MPKGIKIPIIGFAAYSGTGKTTLVSKVIPILRERGLRLGVVKHAHHSFSIDRPGKDSYELRQAGAEQVLVASKQRIAWVMERSEDSEPELMDLLPNFLCQDLDLIIVEGFKHAPIAKIEVHRLARRTILLAKRDEHVIAVATDNPEIVDSDMLTFDLSDYTGIANFIIDCMKRDRLTLFAN